jgi:hypothetical protein
MEKSLTIDQCRLLINSIKNGVHFRASVLVKSLNAETKIVSYNTIIYCLNILIQSKCFEKIGIVYKKINDCPYDRFKTARIAYNHQLYSQTKRGKKQMNKCDNETEIPPSVQKSIYEFDKNPDTLQAPLIEDVDGDNLTITSMKQLPVLALDTDLLDKDATKDVQKLNRPSITISEEHLQTLAASLERLLEENESLKIRIRQLISEKDQITNSSVRQTQIHTSLDRLVNKLAPYLGKNP